MYNNERRREKKLIKRALLTKYIILRRRNKNKTDRVYTLYNIIVVYANLRSE